MEIVLNFTANVFFLGAYIARDILLLRVFCVCGALGNIAFNFSLPERGTAHLNGESLETAPVGQLAPDSAEVVGLASLGQPHRQGASSNLGFVSLPHTDRLKPFLFGPEVAERPGESRETATPGKRSVFTLSHRVLSS